MFIILGTNIILTWFLFYFDLGYFKCCQILMGESTLLGGGHFGHFHDMYVIFFFTKQVALILGFTFGV